MSNGAPADLEALLRAAGVQADVVEHLQSQFGVWAATGFFTAEPRGSTQLAVMRLTEWLAGRVDDPEGNPCTCSLMLIEAPAAPLDPADIAVARRGYDTMRSIARSFPRQKEWADQLVPTVLAAAREGLVVVVLRRDLVVKIVGDGLARFFSGVAGATSRATGDPPTPFLASIALVPKDPYWVADRRENP